MYAEKVGSVLDSCKQEEWEEVRSIHSVKRRMKGGEEGLEKGGNVLNFEIYRWRSNDVGKIPTYSFAN